MVQQQNPRYYPCQTPSLNHARHDCLERSVTCLSRWYEFYACFHGQQWAWLPISDSSPMPLALQRRLVGGGDPAAIPAPMMRPASSWGPPRRGARREAVTGQRDGHRVPP
ncbi:hypothetical protein GUJ93_ZPchr0001g29733 [Zizania palustris]|uniref:Uncharacterized protein n=1 Tax=Zizania palustris TaxID=103762 RepID=A0A8J5RQ70_ZIZPA|nr:hypothetical protein GUJ93_ZPchr0001g29733 [Zizania palustris]